MTLQTLIKIAPLKEVDKTSVLEKLARNEVDEDQKIQISQLCWDLIFKMYDLEWSLTVERMMMEHASGSKKYTPRDYSEEHAKLLYKFTSQLDEHESKEEIEEIQRKLTERKNISSSAIK